MKQMIIHKKLEVLKKYKWNPFIHKIKPLIKMLVNSMLRQKRH